MEKNSYERIVSSSLGRTRPGENESPQGNGIAERFVRILKENLLWVRSFRTVEDLRLALLAFKETYNRKWRIGRHGYRSPAQVREKQKAEVARAA